MNAKLKKHIKSAITREIKRSARKEAFEILERSGIETVGKFLYHYHSDSGNICCILLDTAKDVLVKYGSMKQRKKDSFGNTPLK